MALKFRNPTHINPTEQFIADHKNAIQNYFNNNSDKEFITFDQVRLAFPSQADDLTDNMIRAIMQKLNVEVIEE